MGIRGKIQNILLGARSSSDKFISYLRKKGVKIGDDVIVYVPNETVIDLQYPFLISIGNHVRITQGVKILTHDYAWSVLKKKYGVIFGASGKVEIGDNVFIGMNSIITRGVYIGNNVIIGAGSVVTRNCDSDSVYAGNPARKIMSLEEYFEKRHQAQLEEAKQLVKSYIERNRKVPEAEELHEYFMLFCDEENVQANTTFNCKMDLCENPELSYEYLKRNKALFESYESFLKYCQEDN